MNTPKTKNPSQRNIQIARATGRAWAEHMGEELWLKEPPGRGENLTLAKFPSMVARLARANCYMNFRQHTKNKAQLRKVCGKAAYNRAISWIKQNRAKIEEQLAHV